MSEAVSDNQAQSPPPLKRPGDAEEVIKGPLPPAADVALEDINPVSPRLFS